MASPDVDDAAPDPKQAAVDSLAMPAKGERPPDPRPATLFVVTKQHRRFVEFCDAVRRDRYIGLCHGAPGVGKTLSARRYSHWDTVEPVVRNFRFVDEITAPEQALAARTVFYTPKVHNTPRTVDQEVRSLACSLSWALETTLYPDRVLSSLNNDGLYTELVIIDEADRLKTPSLEALRDHHDRTGAGMILIGMPGIERRLARYPQLYSRVGFLHHYQPMSSDEQTHVLGHRWPELGLTDPDDYTTSEARAAIIRITSGNFRLTTRLMAQIHRIMDINQLHTLTSEVVDTARESLVIGTI
ncbi:AAA family ATPase [Nocardia sp. 852002-20019_SCH5090214]|uniref:AAA family ATPase n=1 Tax=Nocardia sp. 852002-20019_SCH5090214 TaxID=1834087 RepID=UPI000AE51375|nr:AAA family ATPase [Nocardia sp. 852002-20019_SCH5090214]